MRSAPDVESTDPPVGTVHPPGMVGVTVFWVDQRMRATSPAATVGQVTGSAAVAISATLPPPGSAATKETTGYPRIL
jgi:hypothetical protein